MIPRYAVPEITRIFSLEHRTELWLKVELAVVQELERSGQIPPGTTDQIEQALQQVPVEKLVQRAQSLEEQTQHDVVAFLMAVEEVVGEPARWIHFGLTSSDIVDTGLALQIQEAGAVALERFEEVLSDLREFALQHQNTVMMGRTHGMFAEPTTLGLKFLGFYKEFQRAAARFRTALEDLRFGKLSGAVGTNAYLSPAMEKRILKTLGLKREPVATQVIPRDRHAALLTAFALAGTAIERIATEIRHLQRTEVGELEEPFGTKQTGSSAMPHKRNPIRSERLCGLARYLRGLSIPALENVALWHERDISHSSVERLILPDAFHTLVYMLTLLHKILQGLVVHKERIRENLERFGDFYLSQPLLLALIRKGIPRKQAYYWVREVSQAVYDQKVSFREAVQRHPEIPRHLSPEELQQVLSYNFLRHVDEIFREALKREEE